MLYVISDLHLSEGRDPETGRFSRNEDFFFDAEFASFLEMIGQEPGAHLVIAGDLFDFLQVEKLGPPDQFHLTRSEKEHGLGTEEYKTVFKLQVIREGHREFFKALARFLARGGEVTIIKGNHDVELAYEGVQERLRQVLIESLGSEAGPDEVGRIRNRLTFSPWFYYEKDLVWIEHGNQYERSNSFKYFLAPYMDVPGEPRKICLPLGAFFVRYLFNKLEKIHPFADNMKPPSDFVGWVLKRHPWQCVRFAGRYAGAFLRTLAKTGDLEKLGYLRESEKLHAELLSQLAEESGVREGALHQIDGLRAPPALSTRLLQVVGFWRAFVIGAAVLLSVLFYGLPLWFLWPGFGLSYPFAGVLMTLVVVVVVSVALWLLLRGAAALLVRSLEGGDGVLCAASEISDTLGVPLVIFGHTHDAGTHRIGGEGIKRYVNSGTWTKIFYEVPHLIREAKELVYVQSWVDADGPHAELLKWKHELGRGEPVLFFQRH